jgi:NTP pyrophosphatase (non-canonical NTP hydrolase)
MGGNSRSYPIVETERGSMTWVMTFDDYQESAITTAAYPVAEGTGHGNLVYPAMGLAGEAGEYLDKVKKNWRNYNSMTADNLTKDQRLEFLKELGDVLWYTTASAIELGSTLAEVAQININKLLDRRARGVIKSQGDNR